MLVRELLNEEQLDEASLKQMIAGAALALGLGVSGSASAEQLFVYLSPETGKLRAVTDMSRVPANATMSFKVDTDAKTVSMIKGANAPVSPEVAKSAVQSAPKSNPTPVKVAEPDNVKPQTSVDKTPNELNQVKKNAGLPSGEKLTIKGLQFGMSLDDVISKTNATIDDTSKPLDLKTATYPQRTPTNWHGALGKNFTIAGISGWRANAMVEKGLEGLHSLSVFPPAEEVSLALDTFSKQFGKPKITKYKSRTKGGLELDVFNAEWQVNDTVITMTNHVDRDTGIIQIQSKENFDKSSQKYKDQNEKSSKDF